MDQSQLEALLAQMGALGPGDFREETKQEDIPNPAATANGGVILGLRTQRDAPDIAVRGVLLCASYGQYEEYEDEDRVRDGVYHSDDGLE